MSAAREHAIAWRHGSHARVCDRLERWEHGTVVRATDLPTYYDYNLARVEGPDPRLGAGELAAAAEPALAGLGHRRVEVDDEAAGTRLRDGFARMGWTTERFAFLQRELPGPPVAVPSGTELRVEGFEASRSLRTAWQTESIWNETPEFAFVEEAVGRRRGTRATVGYSGGEPIGFAAFSATGNAVEVELVFCLPERRNGGLGGALVAHALAVAEAGGAREAFIETDDDGASKRLYERLGFRTVWRRHSFTKVLDGAQGAGG
jgi:GNAT superfamily N-acetyltransferase